jgi:hypothetical protein
VLKQGKRTQLALYKCLQANQSNQIVWEPLKNFKFGGQFGRTTTRSYVCFLSLRFFEFHNDS